MEDRFAHEMPFGAAVMPGGGVLFRLWAPSQDAVRLVLEDDLDPGLPMERLDDGWFARTVREAVAGTRYRFELGGGMRVPDPASRAQERSVHGHSLVVAPLSHRWQNPGWPGRPWEEAVLYEAHLGCFTPEGTCDGARGKLDHLVSLGVTAIELMPIAELEGSRNWGYDGVLPFAPHLSYGSPEALKRLVDEAHGRGLMVLLDVVYNHFGPSGNYLHLYAPQFFTDRHQTPWGAAINFDGPGSRVVRDFFIHNALYWLEEYRFDGLRLDAVHAIVDETEPDILTELAETVRARIGSARHIHLVLENDRNASARLRRDADRRPCTYDAQWNDDAHHAAHVVLTGEAHGYYADYQAEPVRNLGRALAEGFAYQGERSPHRGGAPRGTPSSELPPLAFVDFLQNHDQIGNRAFGERIATLASDDAVAAIMTLLLLSPHVPLLFMGEEWGSRRPFRFFCDFQGELGAAVRDGRRREFERFPEFHGSRAQDRILDPNAPATFEASRLDWRELAHAARQRDLERTRELLALRHREITPRLSGSTGGLARYEVVDGRALRVRWRLGDGSRLQAAANLSARAIAGLDWPVEGAAIRVEPATIALGSAVTGLPPWSVVWHLATPRDAR
jgi:maltooligosyltrehalose trehalohydrolase